MGTVNSQSNLLADTCEKYYNYVNTIFFDELFQNKELAYEVTQDTFVELCAVGQTGQNKRQVMAADDSTT